MKKFWAFTLTEVLITLSIIGVISVLTLPNVMASYQKRAQVAALQRTYNMIINATSNYMRDNSADDLSLLNIVTKGGMQEFFENYFDVHKICVSTEGNVNGAFSCFEDVYKSSDLSTTFSPKAIRQTGSETVCAILTSGPIVCLEKPTGTDPLFFVHVDTNGRQKPNTAGRDFFGRLRLWSDGKMMGYRYKSHTIYMCPDEGGAPLTLTATGCFARIQEEGWEMNY